MANTCIYWVVALRPEAEPIIQRFKMKLFANHHGKSGFPIWESQNASESDVTHRLVLCGIGKINAAAAVSWLQAVTNAKDCGAVAWINFGIAGHRQRAIGEVIRANKVTDVATGKSWYPPAAWKRKVDLKAAPLQTVDAPTSNYSDEDCLIDMESSGVFAVASRFSSLELIQSIKVISDNAEHAIEGITKESVREACNAALIEIAPWLEAYFEIAREESSRIEAPPLYETLIGCIRFSETQKHQLRRVLIRHHALGTDLQGRSLTALKSGREVIAALSAIVGE